MPMLIGLTGILLCCGGIHLCLLLPTDAELEQAALLPFADDPEAARNMSEATGRRCERVVVPVGEALGQPHADRLEA